MDGSSIRGLISKYNYSVPRYTSFPTAVQFIQTDSCFSMFEEKLKSLHSEKKISLYIHIPFCNSLCHYCGCHTKIVDSYSPIGRYIDSLINEINFIGQFIGDKVKISRIHFGGGSPNYADSNDILKIIDSLKKYFDFSEAQIDMECDPRLLTKEKILSYINMGLSRISLGIQDFDETVQKAINRIQPYHLVKEKVEFLKYNSIEKINFDLIIGLPEQNLDTVEKTLDKAISLGPSRFSVFPYAHVPWMKKHQKLLEKYNLPDAYQRYDISKLVEEKLKKEGFIAIGMDHYARPYDELTKAMKEGVMRRNFQGYTDDNSDVVLGFGLSSITQFEDVYLQNTTNSKTYRESINNKEFAITRVLQLTQEDIERRRLIESLMCNLKVNFDDFKTISIPYDKINELKKDNLLEISDNCLFVNENGKDFLRIIASLFDPYLKIEPNRHAKAI